MDIKYKDRNLILNSTFVNDKGEVAKVLGFSLNGTYEIQFLETLHTTNVSIYELCEGLFYDISKVKFTPKKDIVGQTLCSKRCGDFQVVKFLGADNYNIRFFKTGFIMKASLSNIRRGEVKDPYSRNIYGVACFGEIKHKPPYYKQAYQLWQNMIKRCYCITDNRGYFGKGVTVDDRWLTFSNFLEDVCKLKDFDLWLDGKDNNAAKYNLDKDFLIDGNKVYSREACMFLSEHINKSLGSINRHKKGVVSSVSC